MKLHGVGDACDNCPDTANGDQIDADSSGVGDVCECACWSADEVASVFAECPDGEFFAEEFPEGASAGCLDGTFFGDVTIVIDGESVCVKFTGTADEMHSLSLDQAAQCLDVIAPYIDGGGGPILG